MEGDKRVIHPLSGIAPLPQFELWSVSPTQLSIEKDIESEVRPLSVLSATQPIEFNITSAVDEYINLSGRSSGRVLALRARFHSDGFFCLLDSEERREEGLKSVA